MKVNIPLPKQAKGIVSITVTIVMMLVITVIVLGFAEASRREQRQSLDRQLSTQAFLAAETGVNDARKAMQQSLMTTGAVPNKNNCAPDVSGPYAINPIIDSDNDVRYTCLLVDTTLNNIRQAVQADGTGVTLPLRPEAGNINTLRIKWMGADNATNDGCTTPVGQFPGANNWTCDYGILRVDIVPTDILDRAALMAQQRAFFFYPTGRPDGTPIPTQPYGASAAAVRGTVSPMVCTDLNGDCRVDINGLNGSTTFAVRLTAIYKSGTIDIIGNGSVGSVVFKDAQAQIDSTGRAGDVLRRIQVRLSLGQTSTNSGLALQSGSSICKRFGVTPDVFRVSGDIAGQDPNNPMCRP